MTSKLTIEADADEFDRLLDEAQSICSRYEKDCVILH